VIELLGSRIFENHRDGCIRNISQLSTSMQFYSSSDLVLLVLQGFLEEGEQKGVAGASPHDLADHFDVAKQLQHHQSLVEDDLYMSMQCLPFFRKGINSLFILSFPSTSAMNLMLLAAFTRLSID
jgi:hypothetical protein